MDRWACVNIPALPLQLLLAQHPEWERLPVALVERDAPTGEVLWVNENAVRAGVRPGLSYAAALGLTGELRAGIVSQAGVWRSVKTLTRTLNRFSPEVEASPCTPGVFWLDAVGLTKLYPSLHAWARAVCQAVRSGGFSSSVVVGCTRFGTYAAAKVRGGVTVFSNPDDERQAAWQVPLVRLDLAPDLVEVMDLLGIGTVGDFLRLPASGLQQRFGEEAYELHRRASGDLWTPLQPYQAKSLLICEEDLEYPETDSARLLALIARMIAPLLETLKRRGEALAEVRWMTVLATRERHVEQVRPAEATLDERQILELVRLRLESVTLKAGVESVLVSTLGVPATSSQETLFRRSSRRNLDAADRALARIRAMFGEQAVVAARLTDGYLPEARFQWESLSAAKLPQRSSARTGPLVRRIYTKARKLPLDALNALIHVSGPHVFSGEWWGEERNREYHFAAARDGKLLWIYYDRTRGEWFIQGQVA